MSKADKIKELKAEIARMEQEERLRRKVEAIEHFGEAAGLWDDEDTPLAILPNGRIVDPEDVPTDIKPLTFQENLGGEYART